MSQRVKRRRDNSSPIFRKCDALLLHVILMRQACICAALLHAAPATVCNGTKLFLKTKNNKSISGEINDMQLCIAL